MIGQFDTYCQAAEHATITESIDSYLFAKGRQVPPRLEKHVHAQNEVGGILV